MQVYYDRAALRMALFALLAGAAAGFVNGLAGTGAGVVFLLFWGIFGGGVTRDVFSLSVACVVPLSVLSLLTYSPPAGEILSMVPILALSAGLGGLCGTWVQKRVRLTVLKWAFALLVIWAGGQMLIK